MRARVSASDIESRKNESRKSESRKDELSAREGASAAPSMRVDGAQAPSLSPLQRSVGNAVVLRMLRQGQEGEASVQRSSVHDVLRRPGRPLDGAVRQEMESRLGADFGDVRVHTDSAARASAAEVGAHAYTSGSHIVLGAGGGDRHTLAHELTHVIQQRQGPVPGTDNGAGLGSPTPVIASSARPRRTPPVRSRGRCSPSSMPRNSRRAGHTSAVTPSCSVAS